MSVTDDGQTYSDPPAEIPVETSAETPALDGPALMGIAPSQAYQATVTVTDSAPVNSTLSVPDGILEARHREIMDGLSRIWDHLINRM